MEATSEVRRRGPGRPAKVRAEAPRGIMIRTAGNRFDIDLDRKPDGMSYQWIATTVLGKENREELVAMQQNGWTPVPSGRHPELTGSKPDDVTPIVRGGQMLHERSQEVTDYVTDMDKDAAEEQMGTQLERVAARSSKSMRDAGFKNQTRIARKMVPIAIDGEED